MDATTLILEQRFATFILLRVYRNPGILKKDAIDVDGGSIRVKYETLMTLIRFGLIKEDGTTYKYHKEPVYCTEMGDKVCEHLEKIYEILPYKECSSEDWKSKSPLYSRSSKNDIA